MAIELGEAYVDITAKDKELVKSLNKAQKTVNKSADAMAAKLAGIGKGMAIAGGVITAAFGAIIMKTTQLGDTYDKMSKRTNISVEALSALGYAAKISGADLDTVEKSLRYLARGMDDMSMGVGEAKDAFEFLDIAVVNTEGKLRPTMDVLKEAATKLAAMTDETKQVAVATDIFGARYGTQLLPMLKEGGAGIEALMNKAKELGVVMSTEAAAKAAEFNDRITDLKESVGAIGRDIGTILIPPLIKFSEKAIEIIKRIKEWAEAHKPLVDMIIKVTATLGVLAAVGGPILLAVSAFMKLKGAIIAVGTALKVLGTIATGPIGLLILAVGGLYLAWEKNLFGMKDITEEVFASIKGNFVDLQNTLSGGGGGAGAFFDEIGEAGKKLPPVFNDIADVLKTVNKVAGDAGITLDEFNETQKRLRKEVEAAAKALKEKLADALKTVTDRIYELTHTEIEYSIKKLQEQKQAYLDLGMAIEEVDKWYALEIAKLDEVHPKKKRDEEDNKDLADSYKELEKPIEGAAKAIEESGNIAERTSEKYHNLAESIGSIYEQMQRVKWERLNKIAGSQAGIIAGSQPGVIAGSNPLIPHYQHGIPSVPETGLAVVHKGEKITPASQNSYDQRKSYSPNINVTVLGNGDEGNIKRAVQEALDESNKQYLRQGKEILLGA